MNEHRQNSVAQFDSRTDAEWQEDLNTAHFAIRMGAKLTALGVMTDEQLRKCWEIQTAASARGLVPQHEPSAWEREYKRILVSHGLLDADGRYVPDASAAATERMSGHERARAASSESSADWYRRVTGVELRP
jgi:hypothetical protein